MKHLLFCLVLISIFLFPHHASAQDYGWEIESFHADINVQEDGAIDVTETIETNFTESKHGIYRDIPVKYRNRFNQHIKIGLNVKNVTDENGVPYEYELSREGAYQRIKIGDPDRSIDGQHTYVITYQAERGLRYLDNQDELYWNITGNAWEVPIPFSSAIVHLPFSTDELETICFTGPTGSTAQDCTLSNQGSQIEFAANDFMTVAISWPKGLIAAPSAITKAGWFASDNWGFILPIIAALGAYYVWFRRGRDPKGKGIVRQYEAPDKLSPAETGFLVNQSFKTDFVSAEIIVLAELGYITIKEITKDGWIKKSTDYELYRQNGAKPLKPHQQTLLDALFADAIEDTILISDLPTNFHQDVEAVKQAVWSEIQKAEYFADKPDVAVGKWIGLAMLVSFGLFALALFHDMRSDLAVGGLVSAIILFTTAFFMPKRTVKGVAAYEYALGFKQYIDAAETDRVKWQEKQNIFFEVLPYAMVFGIADKWAKAFEGKLTQPPSWYSGSPMTTFSAMHFSSSMNSFSAATTMHSSPPSSSSSGFSGGSSGGGGGGGGGGSW